MDQFGARRDKLRKLIRKAEVDGLLVTNFANVTYLTGFTGDDSYLLVFGKDELLVSDFRYVTQLETECPGLRLAIRRTGVPMAQAVARAVKTARPATLGIEGQSLTVSMRELLAKKLPKVSLITTAGMAEGLREIKDQDEIAATREAIWIAEKAFSVIRASVRPEQTEKQVADQLEHELRLFGATAASFPPIVAAGARAALPHARPGSGRIGDDDLVLIDWGASGRLYKSDLTRVLVTGKISPKLERIYGVVLRAQLKAIDAIKPGATGEEVDAVARKVIHEAGYGRYFGHGLGHGIGLDIHELPRLAPKMKLPLRAGMIVTVEPGIYVPGWGGVRIEDDVLVTRTGHEVLSSLPKELPETLVDY